MAMQRLYETGTDFNQAPLRVNPNYPLPSSLPALHGPSQNSLTNGVARTTSKRRRPSATGSGRTPADKFSQPPAPEVPKAPPIAYRPPYSSEIQSHPVGHYPASFAERARALTANSIPTVPDPHSEPETTPQPARRERRGSLNRPIGGLYSEIQKHRRDSYPPPNGPISPRRFSNTTNPEQYENLDANSPSQKASPAVAHQYTISSPVQTLSSPRGAPVGLEKPPRKEWAPDRSPLQKLEIKLSDISKEEKRARVEEAEQRLRESKARDRGSKFVREVEPIVARNSSRQVSADAAAANSSKLSDHTQRLQEDTNGQRPPANRMEANIIPQPEKPSNQSTSGSYPQRTSEGISIDFYQPLSGDRSRKASASATKTSQSDQQLGRGVRFQGEEDTGGHGAYSPDSNQMDSRSRGRNCGMEALARSDEVQSARQDKLRQKPSSTANQSSSKQIPVGQKELYNGKPLNSHECSPAARHRGLLDPVPRNSVQSDSQVPKYEVPPQTAAVVGSGSGPQQVTEVPAHRKHHLSAILNRGHKHAVDTYEQTNSRPGNLDEWKYGGTARLTAADFITEEEPDDKNRAWWEKGNSDPRRKPGRVREAQPPRNHLQTENGKIPSPIFPRATKAEWPPSHDRAPRTRQYLEPDQYLRIGRAPDPYHESHVPHFLHRTKNEQALRLSSVYSYSCPNLADHVPAHSSHVCEPYLSKELTLSMRSVRIRPAPALATFDPPLYLKSGPLLRYTGLRRDRLQTKSRSGPSSSERETWRGSVMIVTADADSSYDPAPILRLFPEPMDHLPTPPQHVEAQNGHDLPSEYIDPIAGLPKLSRSGKTVYVKPVDDLEQGVDLSRVENDDGLFEEFRTAAVPTAYGTPDFRPGRNTDPSLANRTSRKGQQVRGVRLHAERGVTFWRFNLEVELGVQQTRVAYSINKSPSVGFWIPGRGQSMNVMFHSCNGFSMSVK